MTLSPPPAAARGLAWHPPAGGPPLQADWHALADEAWAMHRAMAGYAPTPLVPLRALAARLGIGQLWAKDESHRFGLNAFKALGASFAVHRWLARHGRGGRVTFTTATDGNHGHAVAWAAAQAGHDAVVYVPHHTVEARISRIARTRARVVVVDGDYDTAVQAADAASRLHGWPLIQDTAYDGYEEIPAWIAAGYTTHFRECEATLHPPGTPDVDVVLLHAGVGSWAASAAVYYWHRYGARRPRLVVVEPTEAACLYASAEAGAFARATGTGHTIMAGLNCATASTTAWAVLRDAVDAWLAIDDAWAAEAMRRLYHPAGDDPRLVAGESGAAGVAGLLALCSAPDLAPLRAHLGVGPTTRVLSLVTEGDTDPDAFRRIVAAGG